MIGIIVPLVALLIAAVLMVKRSKREKTAISDSSGVCDLSDVLPKLRWTPRVLTEPEFAALFYDLTPFEEVAIDTAIAEAVYGLRPDEERDLDFQMGRTK